MYPTESQTNDTHRSIYSDNVTLNQGIPLDKDKDFVKLFRNHIKLNKGISQTNYIAYNLFFFVITFSFVSADTLQPILLNTQTYFNIPQGQVATVNANIQLWDLLTKIAIAPFYGILTDVIGRKFFIVFGILCMSIGILGMSLVHQIYPYYLIFRLIFANGAIACLCSPLLADYVHFETKGRASGILVILAACGALFSTWICIDLSNFSISLRYYVVAAIVLVGGLIVSFGIKGGDYYKKHEQDGSEVFTHQNQPAVRAKNPCKFYLSGILEAKNPWILMGYFVSFLSRGDSALLTYTLVLWSQTFYSSDQTSQDQAAVQAQTLAGLAYTMILLSALLYGFLADKFSKFKLTIFILGVTILGMALLIISPSPTSAFAWIAMVPIGLGMGGLLTTSLQFVNKYADRRYRGNINSISTAVGVFGIFCVSVIGGYMIDSISANAPFYLYGGLAGLVFLVLMSIWVINPSVQNEKEFDSSFINNHPISN